MSSGDGPRIVLDARPLSHPQAGGFRSYVRALVQGWKEHSESNEGSGTLILYLDRPLAPEVERAIRASGIQTRVLSKDRLRTDLRLFREQLQKDCPDLVHGTSNYLPALPDNIPATLTLHDALGIRCYPWDRGITRTPRERFIHGYWAWRTRASTRIARRIIAVSQGAARELGEALALPSERLAVVYNGLCLPSPCRESPRDPGIILAIESPDPRKNLILLYRALSEHGEFFRAGRPRLVVVASGATAAARTEANLRQFPGIEARILTGLSDQALSDTYAGASIFAWPSRWEGFGLPPLEAMRNGCAVVSSNAPVMPEVLGDIPCYADPDDAAGFATQLAHLLAHPDEREQRVRLGRTHAATFTCRRMADETTAVWREALA